MYIFSSEPQSSVLPSNPSLGMEWLAPWSPAWFLLSHNSQPPRMENPLERPELAVSGVLVAFPVISAQGHTSGH